MHADGPVGRTGNRLPPLSGKLLPLILVAAATLLAAPPPARAAPTVVVALFPSETLPAPGAHVRTVLDRLADHPQFALGMVSGSQGPYDPLQSLLDLSQGARLQIDLYKPQPVPALVLSGGRLSGWAAVTERAARAPASVVPGLLAAAVPGGAAFTGIAAGAYAHVPGAPPGRGLAPSRFPDAALAAGLDGRIARVSLGPSATVAARAGRAHRRLSVVELPAGRAGEIQLEALLARRAPDELLVALQAPPVGVGSGYQTLWLGIAGLRPTPGGMLTSHTTHVPGYVSSTDIAPTIIRHLGVAVPKEMDGQPVTAPGRTDAAALLAFRSRIAVADGRKIPALQAFLLAWGALIILFGLFGADRRGLRTGLRAGGAAVLWLPPLSMLTAAVDPSRTLELAVLAGGALALGTLTDRLVRWPRAPAVPAVIGLIVYAIDLARGSPLLDRSLLGPSPLAGVRFYGVDNDLEIAITLMLLAAFAGAIRHRGRVHRSAYVLLAGGLGLAVIVCPGRLGADVGGVFTIAAGVAVGALMLLPRISRWALGLALASPFLGLVALALVDVGTGGNSHFVRTVLDANSTGDIADLLRRRYDVAWSTLRSDFEVPLYTVISLLIGAYAYRFRERLYAGVDEAWRAFLGGGFAAALACAVFNDSGPLPLIQGVGVLAVITAYLRCPPDSVPVPAGEGLPRANAPPLVATSV